METAQQTIVCTSFHFRHTQAQVLRSVHVINLIQCLCALLNDGWPILNRSDFGKLRWLDNNDHHRQFLISTLNMARANVPILCKMADNYPGGKTWHDCCIQATAVGLSVQVTITCITIHPNKDMDWTSEMRPLSI